MYCDEIHIGEKIQFVFNQSGLSVSQFARLVGVQRTRIYTIFESKAIDTDLLCKISDALHYDFLAEVYLKKRILDNRHPNTININFTISCENLGEFIKAVDRLKRAGVV